MTRRRSLKEFSLVELLIVIAVISIVASVGLPAYRAYIDTANMSKTTSAYEYAIRLVRQKYTLTLAKEVLGIVGLFAKDTIGWINLLNIHGEGLAPDRDTAYVPWIGKRKQRVAQPTSTLPALLLFFKT